MILNNNIQHPLLAMSIADPDSLALVASSLSSEMFHGVEAKAFSFLKSQYDKGLSLNWPIFAQEMARLGVSAEFIKTLQSAQYNLDDLFSYIESFKTNIAASRINALKGKLDKITSGSGNLDDMVSALNKEVDEAVNVKGIMSDDVIDLSEYLPEYLGKQSKLAESVGSMLGLETGIPEYDKLTSGLCSSDLIVLAGRPAMGKTSMALSLLFKEIKQGSFGMFFSLEMPTDQIMHRLISMYSGIPLSNIRNGRLSERQQSQFSDAIKFIKETCSIACSDKGGVTFSELKRKAISQHKKKPLKYLIIDYLQLMSLSDIEGNNKSEKLGAVTGGLKSLAKELDIPIILLSQLSRECEGRADKRPMPSDLRESGAIEQDADIILFVYRDVVYNSDTKEPEKAELIIAKQRNGATGTVPTRFIGHNTLFTAYNVA